MIRHYSMTKREKVNSGVETFSGAFQAGLCGSLLVSPEGHRAWDAQHVLSFPFIFIFVR